MAVVPHFIRPMVATDLPDVARLEQSAGDVRWTEAQLRAELEKTIARYFVAIVLENRIAGYVGGWIIPPELQVANIVIDSEFRCRGLGRRLLETLVDQAQREGCMMSTLEVRRTNVHAQSLYRAAGYVQTSVRANAYVDDDAILMEKTW
jgi:ribosomal-protein-alanine N-acetyltransferase